jgi:hypothetical protein
MRLIAPLFAPQLMWAKTLDSRPFSYGLKFLQVHALDVSTIQLDTRGVRAVLYTFYRGWSESTEHEGLNVFVVVRQVYCVPAPREGRNSKCHVVCIASRTIAALARIGWLVPRLGCGMMCIVKLSRQFSF